MVNQEILKDFKSSWDFIKEFYEKEDLKKEKDEFLSNASRFIDEEELGLLEIYLGDENVW